MASNVPQVLLTVRGSGLLGRDRPGQVVRELAGPGRVPDASMRVGFHYHASVEIANLLGDWLLKRAAPGSDRIARADSAVPLSASSARRRDSQGDDRRAPDPASTIPDSPIAEPSPTSHAGGERVLGLRANPALPECWARWAKVFEAVAAGRKPRLPLGETSYRSIHDKLLLACREATGPVDEPGSELRRQVEQFVIPCLTLDALRSILRAGMKGIVVGRFREIDRALRPRPWPTPRGRFLLKLGASAVAATLVGQSLPLSEFASATSRVARSVLANARSVLKEACDFQERVRGIH